MLRRCGLLIILAAAAVAAPVPIAPGKDGFHTAPGTLFNPNPLLPGGFPSGFFGDKMGIPSDAIPGPLPVIAVGPGPDLEPVPVITTYLTGPGCHTGSMNAHCYLQTLILFDLVDTIVMRSGGVLDGALSLDIMLVHLSLQSLLPIPVTYGGANLSYYFIVISLDGPQPVGSLTLTQLGMFDGFMDTILPVNYKVSFIASNPLDPLVADVTGLQEILSSQRNRFTIVPEGGTLLLTGLGLLAFSRYHRHRRSG